jgi:hypothetical protein
MCYPLLGIGFTLALYFYLKHILGRVINTVEDGNYINNKNIEFNQKDVIDLGVDPHYILDIARNYNNFIEPSSKFHE